MAIKLTAILEKMSMGTFFYEEGYSYIFCDTHPYILAHKMGMDNNWSEQLYST